MKLQDFVKESLSQIVLGVRGAQDSVAHLDGNGEISPPLKTHWLLKAMDDGPSYDE